MIALPILVLFWAGTASFAQEVNPGADLPEVPAGESGPPQPASEIEPPESGWRVQCGQSADGTECAAQFDVFSQQTSQVLITVFVIKPAGGGNDRLLLRMPHGLHLPSDVEIQVDSRAGATLEFTTCDANACFVDGGFNETRLRDFKAGATLHLRFETANRDNVEVPVSLTGFTAAYEQASSAVE